MRNLMRAVVIAMFMFAGAAWAAETGYIHAISGEATIARAGQAPVKAKLGDLFEEGTSFATAADGKVTLKFADGQVIALSPQTQFTVTSYVYSSSNVAQNNVLFSMARGGMRFVTGLIGQTDRSKFAIRTPTLTAGVRGTDGIIVQADNGATVVSVLDGVVTITTAKGTLVINKGRFAFWKAGTEIDPSNPTSTGTVFTRDSGGQTDVGLILEAANDLGNKELPQPNPVDVVQAAKDVIDAANQSGAGAPGSPAPTPGPAGGGGGGTGVSPS